MIWRWILLVSFNRRFFVRRNIDKRVLEKGRRTYFIILFKVSHLTPSPHSQYVWFSVKYIVRRDKARSCKIQPLLLISPFSTSFSKSSMALHRYTVEPVTESIFVTHSLSVRGFKKPSSIPIAQLAEMVAYAEL